MENRAYPTKKQAERIASKDCPIGRCNECDIALWCVPVHGYTTAPSRACGRAMLAMYDEIDRLRECLRNVQGELLARFDIRELPDLNMIEMAQRIDKWLSTDEVGD